MIPSWLSFFIAIGVILIFSKYELSLVLSLATLLFAILTQIDILASLYTIFTDATIILLAIAVGIIPVLGGIMEESGLMMELVQKLNVSKKVSMMVVPAFYGLLPVAGGALMSAPILEQIDKDMNPNRKVAINVWFRHILILIYPLSSSMIVASVLTGISLYILFFSLIPSFLVMIVAGYFILVRKVSSSGESHERDLKRVLHNICPVILAPIIDFIGRFFFNFVCPEIFLIVGLCFSLIIAVRFANMSLDSLKSIIKKMKIWRFPLLILSMFWFLEVFVRSGVPEDISALNLSFILFICIGFALGFATGRIQLPFSILAPIYLIQFVVSVMPILDFVFLYTSVFLGYLVTPLHPCLSYSVEYFETTYKNAVKYLSIPTFLCFGLLLLLYLLISLFFGKT